MTEETKTPAPATEPKKRGRKPGSTNSTINEKGAALALVDFFGGSYKRAASASGIPVRTLMNWRAEIEAGDVEAAEIQAARVEGGDVMMEALKRFIEALMAIAILKAAGASFKDIYYALGIACDKFEKLMIVYNQQRQILNAQVAALNAQTPAEVGDAVLKPPADPKAQWEEIVSRVIADAEKAGTPMTREEAIAGIIEQRPEAKEFLM